MTVHEDLRRDRARDDNDAAAEEDPYRRCLSDFRRDKFPDHTLPFHLAARERTSGYSGSRVPGDPWRAIDSSALLKELVAHPQLEAIASSSSWPYRCHCMGLDAHRTNDNTPVDDAAALEAWERAARPVLVQVARRYGSLMAPADLAEEVQALSGVRTREAPTEWIDDVLDAVGAECGARSEPLLSAFCVDGDGRIGDRYEQVVVSIDGTTPVDIEMHAATQRVEAHRYHGATLPVDGGRPTLPPQLAQQRASAAKKAATRTRAPRVPKAPAAPRKPKNPEVVRAVCPTCFLQLPATGRCDNCDD